MGLYKEEDGFYVDGRDILNALSEGFYLYGTVGKNETYFKNFPDIHFYSYNDKCWKPLGEMVMPLDTTFLVLVKPFKIREFKIEND